MHKYTSILLYIFYFDIYYPLKILVKLFLYFGHLYYFRQEIVLIGTNMDAADMRSKLESCLLSDEEMSTPHLWSTYDDPFPPSDFEDDDDHDNYDDDDDDDNEASGNGIEVEIIASNAPHR